MRGVRQLEVRAQRLIELRLGDDARFHQQGGGRDDVAFVVLGADMLADIQAFDGVAHLVHAELLQVIGTDKHQAVGQVLPVLLEHRLVAEAVDGVRDFAKALKPTEIVKAIHREYL